MFLRIRAAGRKLKWPVLCSALHAFIAPTASADPIQTYILSDAPRAYEVRAANRQYTSLYFPGRCAQVATGDVTAFSVEHDPQDPGRILVQALAPAGAQSNIDLLCGGRPIAISLLSTSQAKAHLQVHFKQAGEDPHVGRNTLPKEVCDQEILEAVDVNARQLWGSLLDAGQSRAQISRSVRGTRRGEFLVERFRRIVIGDFIFDFLDLYHGGKKVVSIDEIQIAGAKLLHVEHPAALKRKRRNRVALAYRTGEPSAAEITFRLSDGAELTLRERK